MSQNPRLWQRFLSLFLLGQYVYVSPFLGKTRNILTMYETSQIYEESADVALRLFQRNEKTCALRRGYE